MDKMEVKLNELEAVTGGTGGSAKPLPEKAGCFVYHIVKGDTLGEIAGRCRTTVQFLMQINPEITDKNKIKIGQKILIPKI